MRQDIAIAICQSVFLPSMVPTLLGKDKPALSTRLMNGVIVAVITITFMTLQLWSSVVTGVMTALIWFTLAAQKSRTELQEGTSNMTWRR